jgi:hypothetical protein
MPNAWTTPTYGIPGRTTISAFKVELDFAATPDPLSLRPWELMRIVLGIVGDHKLSISSHAPERVLIDTPRPWRAGRYSCELTAMLSDLGDEQLWRDIAPALQHNCYIWISRGTCERRHFAWWFTWNPARGLSACEFTLAICTAHIPTPQYGPATALQNLIDTAFNLGALNEHCRGGRAGTVMWLPSRPPQPEFAGSYEGMMPDHFQPQLGSGVLHDDSAWSWRDASKPLVPYIALSNLLAPGLIKALGGIDGIRKAHDNIAFDKQHPQFDLHALPSGFARLQFSDITDFTLRDAAGRDGTLDISRPGVHWFAVALAKAKLFLFQDESWQKRRRAENLAAQRAMAAKQIAESRSTRKSRFQERSKSEQRDELRHFWSNPPRCIHDVAAIAPPTKELAAHGLHEHTTHFWIQPNQREEAFTIYGAPTGKPNTIASPIRIGSTKKDRAVAAFDASEDGWDAESSRRERLLKTPERRLKQLVCPECQGRMFKPLAAFEYPMDDDLRSDAEAWKRRQDYFTWFWLIAYCATCPWNAVVADIECA